MQFTKKERTIMATLGNTPDKFQYVGDVRSLIDKGIVICNELGEAKLTEVTLEINITGHIGLFKMTFQGIGAYPYPCGAKTRYPNDPVYAGNGAWDTLRDYDYDPISGLFKMPYGLK